MPGVARTLVPFRSKVKKFVDGDIRSFEVNCFHRRLSSIRKQQLSFFSTSLQTPDLVFRLFSYVVEYTSDVTTRLLLSALAKERISTGKSSLWTKKVVDRSEEPALE